MRLRLYFGEEIKETSAGNGESVCGMSTRTCTSGECERKIMREPATYRHSKGPKWLQEHQTVLTNSISAQPCRKCTKTHHTVSPVYTYAPIHMYTYIHTLHTKTEAETCTCTSIIRPHTQVVNELSFANYGLRLRTA